MYNKFVIFSIIVLLMGSGLGLVYAHCPAEGLQDSGSFFTGIDWIYGSASVSNLKYWPFGDIGQAYISSDHSILSWSYHEDHKFTAFWKFRLFVDGEWVHRFQTDPIYSGTLPKYDLESQPMPEPLFDSETLWVNVNDLSAPIAGIEYTMSASTRLDVYFGRNGGKKHSWKDCVNIIQFRHFPPPR